jgi:ribosomal protein S18 acetylase RimI-like enzyme
VSAVFAATVLPLAYYSDEAKRNETGKYTPEQLAISIEDDPRSVLVAESQSGEIIGFCFSRFDDGLIWLAWFGVSAAWRKAGVGHALLEALQQTVRPRAAHKIWCDSRTANKASASVLSRFGFEKICTVTNHWYGHDYDLWEKRVEDP